MTLALLILAIVLLVGMFIGVLALSLGRAAAKPTPHADHRVGEDEP
jgi:uncharacterized membrane-anchored protein YhcB (DUF1043 family)